MRSLGVAASQTSAGGFGGAGAAGSGCAATGAGAATGDGPAPGPTSSYSSSSTTAGAGLGRGRPGHRRGRLGHRRRRRRGGGRPFRLSLAHGRLQAARVELPRDVLQRHVDRQRQLVPRLLPDRRQAPLAVDQLEVGEEARVALALRLERVVVVPAGAPEVVQRAPEVEHGSAEVGGVGRVEAQPDRGAVEDRVRHVALAQQPPQPLGLGGPDVERLARVGSRARSACPCRSARPSRGPR